MSRYSLIKENGPLLSQRGLEQAVGSISRENFIPRKGYTRLDGNRLVFATEPNDCSRKFNLERGYLKRNYESYHQLASAINDFIALMPDKLFLQPLFDPFRWGQLKEGFRSLCQSYPDIKKERHKKALEYIYELALSVDALKAYSIGSLNASDGLVNVVTPYLDRYKQEQLVRTGLLSHEGSLYDSEIVNEAAPNLVEYLNGQGVFLLRAALGQGAKGSVYLADVVGDDFAKKVGPLESDKVVVKLFNLEMQQMMGELYVNKNLGDLLRLKVEDPYYRLAKTYALLLQKEDGSIVFLTSLDIAKMEVGNFDTCKVLGLIGEYIEGARDLSCYRFRAQPLSKVSSLGYDIMQGLLALHDEKIVYRDLKLENILTYRDIIKANSAKIIDFDGLIPISGESIIDLVGTRPYLAPELLDPPHFYSEKTDAWAFGCLLVELATGMPLFSRSHSRKEREAIQSYSKRVSRGENLREVLNDVLRESALDHGVEDYDLSCLTNARFFDLIASLLDPDATRRESMDVICNHLFWI